MDTSFHYTVVLRVWGWQNQKCNSKCPNDINTEWAIPEKKLKFYFTLGYSRQNKASPLETPHNCVTPFINFKANQDPWKFHVIFSWSRPENSTLFLSHKNKFIAIENKYLSEWSFFLNQKFLFVHERNFNPKVINYF